jgi:uncharacterized protein (TIGR00369 family)
VPDVALTPYAEALGIVATGEEAGAPIVALEFAANVEGRPGALHGGAIGGLLETAAYVALRAEMARQSRDQPLKPINITVQYLSPGLMQRTCAVGRVVRLGRRTANVSVEAWQDARDKPIASALMNILVADPR